MSKERKSTAAPILAVLAIILLAAGVGYFFTYCWLGKVRGATVAGDGSPLTFREFSSAWMPVFFTPAGWLEAKVGRREVILNCEKTVGAIPHFNP